MTRCKSEFDLYCDDWKHTENVVDGLFAYSPDRKATEAGDPVAPVRGTKVRVGDPTQNEIAIAATTHGYRKTDKRITIWATTLRPIPNDKLSPLIEPNEGDLITVAGVPYIIKSVHTVVYGTQHVCYCQRSTKVK